MKARSVLFNGSLNLAILIACGAAQAARPSVENAFSNAKALAMECSDLARQSIVQTFETDALLGDPGIYRVAVYAIAEKRAIRVYRCASGETLAGCGELIVGMTGVKATRNGDYFQDYDIERGSTFMCTSPGRCFPFEPQMSLIPGGLRVPGARIGFLTEFNARVGSLAFCCEDECKDQARALVAAPGKRPASGAATPAVAR